MKLGMGDVRWAIYFNNLIGHLVIAWTGYLLLGGWRLLRKAPQALQAPTAPDAPQAPEAPELDWQQWLTCAVIIGLVASVILLKLNVGVTAFAGAVILTLSRAADESAAVKAMPWGVIMMVCGVTLLVSMVEKAGGMALFAGFLGRLATPESVTAVSAFFSGLISIYSSTIAVVLPSLLPTVNDLVKNIGGGNPLAIVSSMIVGGHVVDVSPLSTLGALCLAAAPPGTNTKKLFNQLLAWGVSMTVVAAVVCWVIFR
jgi:di/tricarboxylate transporter